MKAFTTLLATHCQAAGEGEVHGKRPPCRISFLDLPPSLHLVVFSFPILSLVIGNFFFFPSSIVFASLLILSILILATAPTRSLLVAIFIPDHFFFSTLSRIRRFTWQSPLF